MVSIHCFQKIPTWICYMSVGHDEGTPVLGFTYDLKTALSTTLTSSPCLSCSDLHPEAWTLYAGIEKSRDNLFSPPHSVRRIVAHEGFSRLTMQNDIALVQLSGPLNITGGCPIIN